MTSADVTRARQHSVGDLLHRTAQRYPDKLAVVSGELRVSYAEFDAAVNRTANALADRGLTKGDRLALLSHNCWQYAVLAFSTAKLGVVLVPVNFMLGPEEIAFILRHSGASGMVSEDTLAPTADKALASAGVSEGVRGWIGLSGAAPSAVPGGAAATTAHPRWPSATTTRCGSCTPPAPSPVRRASCSRRAR
jgi:fatty-acyl-CoA synthase